MTLQQAIEQCDGSAGRLEGIAEVYAPDSSSFQEIVSILSGEDEDLQKAAVAVLKYWVAGGFQPDALQLRRLFETIERPCHWVVRLVLYQQLVRLLVPTACREHAERFYMKGLSDNNKFVRAWAYNGLYELSRQYEDLRIETMLLLDAGLNDEAASVRARIRNILRAENKTTASGKTARRKKKA